MAVVYNFTALGGSSVAVEITAGNVGHSALVRLTSSSHPESDSMPPHLPVRTVHCTYLQHS